ncbi:hypothetical protein [Cohnella sp. 56]|uniref:hypothetical protein n=1 Tax=Cohnella sp. 56 TaxID=3113722 RepID=UPI0030E8DA94
MLRPQERAVTDFILAHPNQTVIRSVHKLAQLQYDETGTLPDKTRIAVIRSKRYG